jgi:hypothetical protein
MFSLGHSTIKGPQCHVRSQKMYCLALWLKRLMTWSFPDYKNECHLTIKLFSLTHSTFKGQGDARSSSALTRTRNQTDTLESLLTLPVLVPSQTPFLCWETRPFGEYTHFVNVLHAYMRMHVYTLGWPYPGEYNQCNWFHIFQISKLTIYIIVESCISS